MDYTFVINSKKGIVLGNASSLVETRKKAIDKFLRIIAKSPNHYDYIAIYSGKHTHVPRKMAYETIFVHGYNPYSWNVDQVLDVYTYSDKRGKSYKGIVTRDGRLFKTDKITPVIISHIEKIGIKVYKDYIPKK